MQGKTLQQNLDGLRPLLAEIINLRRAAALLSWDQQTYMPPKGVQGRAEQLALLRRLEHERMTADDLGKLLSTLEDQVATLDPDSDEVRLVKVTLRDYNQARKLPAALVTELSKATTLGRQAWAKARQENDFAAFVPYLERNIQLAKEVADHLGYEEHPYDALVDRSEPGMTASQLRTLFDELKAVIVPLVREIVKRQDRVDDSILHRDYDPEKQLQFGKEVITRYGYDFERGREDLTAHPFATSFGLGDVRITTRYSRNFLSEALFGTLHESGHGMYEQGINPKYDYTTLCRGASSGMHESQSRLWENLVGRSRSFWRYWYGKLQATFPESLSGVDMEQFYRAANKVTPSFIRVEADEVTYNLHILLRFELENELLDGKLKVADLPQAWNAKMQEYLGITPENDRLGVLQDVHWSGGASLGGFPGYTIGNVVSAQLFARVREVMPDLDDQIAAGEFGNLHTWLRENLYQYGRKFLPNELAVRITGKPIGVQDWANYVRRKFGELYGLS